MIIFQLHCDRQHTFEGWFSDSHDYDQQKKQGLLTCPLCESRHVEKTLTGTPLIRRSNAKPAKQPLKKEKIDPVVLLKAITHQIRKNCEDVGSRFYSEAIKMHSGDTPKRAIIGEVTPQEREKLDDAAIPYTPLPKLGPEFEN